MLGAKKERIFQPEHHDVSEAVAEALSLDEKRDKKMAQDLLGDWSQQLVEIEGNVGSKGRERKEAKFGAHGLVKTMKRESRTWKSAALDGEMREQLNELLERAKKAEKELTSRWERARSMVGKGLLVLGGAFLVHGTLERFHSIEALQDLVKDAQATSSQYEAPPVPTTMCIVGDEAPRHHVDTSDMYRHFRSTLDTKEAKEKLGSNFRLAQDAGENMERLYVRFGSSLGGFMNVENGMEKPLVDRLGKSAEQLRFERDVVHDGLFDANANLAGGLTDQLANTEHILKEEKNGDWYAKQFDTAVGFVDRVYEERLAKLEPVTRAELKDELSTYLKAEMSVRAWKEIVKVAVDTQDKDLLEGRATTIFSGSSEPVEDALRKSLDARDTAIDALYKEMSRLHVGDAFEGQEAHVIARLRDLSELRKSVVAELTQEADKGILAGDGEVLGGMLSRIDTEADSLKQSLAVLQKSELTPVASK